MSDAQGTPVRLGGTGIPAPRLSITEVKVVGFDMPFLNLVGFFIKAALAAVPAAIIIGIIWSVVAWLVFGSFMGRHMV